MNWPLASDYQDAIQNPAICFQDADLKGGQPAVNRLGLPRVASGSFASVYEISRSSRKWAVRCFLRPAADQQQRYAALSQYLSRRSVSGLVGFVYLPAGIRVRAQWRPIVKMEWVEGVTLHTYVSRHVQNGAKLKYLTLQWRGLMERLRQGQIAHCDLQHGNVLVTPQEQLRLVDYDGMYVPPLQGQSSQELGHPNYQHPRRSAADYDENLDSFSAIVIYTALRALIAEPHLWQKYDTGENLLFSASDYRAPARSALFAQLQRSPDPAVRLLAARIIAACAGTVAQVPDFQRLVDSLPAIPEPEPWWHGPGANPNGGGAPTPVPGGSAPPEHDPPPASGPWWKGPSRSVLTPEVILPTPPRGPVYRAPTPSPARIGGNEAVARSFRSGCAAFTSITCLVMTLLFFGVGIAVLAVVHKVEGWLAPPAAAPSRPLPAPHRATRPKPHRGAAAASGHPAALWGEGLTHGRLPEAVLTRIPDNARVVLGPSVVPGAVDERRQVDLRTPAQ